MSKECENCIKRKTMWCPTSMDCMALDELPYYLDKISALEKIDKLKQENKQLKDLYRKTCEHLFNIGNDELARYFQAQINECPTFTTQILGDKEKVIKLNTKDMNITSSEIKPSTYTRFKE